MSKKAKRKPRSGNRPSPMRRKPQVTEGYQAKAKVVGDTRRKVIFGVATAAAIGAIGYGILSAGESSATPALAQNSASAEPTKKAVTEASPEIFRNMPRIEKTEGSIDSYRPVGLDITDEAFEVASDKYSKQVQSYTANAFSAAAAETGIGGIEFLNSYYAALFEMARNIPEFRSYVEKIEAGRGNKADSFLCSHLKPLLIPSGHYFDVDDREMQSTRPGIRMRSVHIRIHRIKGASFYRVSDQNETVTVPVLTLGPAFIESTQKNSQYVVAKFDAGIDVVTYREDQGEVELNKVVNFLSKHELLPENVGLEELRVVNKETVINHELTHALQDGRYDRYRMAADVLLHTPLTTPFANGRSAELTGNYSVENFRELAAIGSEIYNTKPGYPLALAQRLMGTGDRNMPTSSNRLASRAVTPVTINYAPDSEMKRRILSLITQRKIFKSADSIRMILETFSDHDRKMVGATMYSMAVELLEASEKGRLKPVNR